MARKSVPSPIPATAQPAASAVQPKEQMGCLAAVVRLSWLAAGNLVLVGMALMMTRRQGPSALDAVYGGIALALIGLRYLDITRFAGRTSDGEPATLADWRRYSVKLLVFAAVAAGAAHLVGALLG